MVMQNQLYNYPFPVRSELWERQAAASEEIQMQIPYLLFYPLYTKRNKYITNYWLKIF